MIDSVAWSRWSAKLRRCLQVRSMCPGQHLALVTERNVQVEVERGPTSYQIRSDEAAFDTGPIPADHAIDCLKRLGAL